MKKITTLIVVQLLVLSANAQVFHNLNQDSLGVANLLLNGSVKECIQELESSERAKLSVTQVARSNNRLPQYVLSGMLIQGGDMATKQFALKLTPRLDRGIVYDCVVDVRD